MDFSRFTISGLPGYPKGNIGASHGGTGGANGCRVEAAAAAAVNKPNGLLRMRNAEFPFMKGLLPPGKQLNYDHTFRFA